MIQIRVLTKAIEMVTERSDIHITYDDTERIGRKVIAITFHGKLNNQSKAEHLGADELILQLGFE